MLHITNVTHFLSIPGMFVQPQSLYTKSDHMLGTCTNPPGRPHTSVYVCALFVEHDALVTLSTIRHNETYNDTYLCYLMLIG